MKVDVNLLRGRIVSEGLTQEQVASKIGMDRSTFSRKMRSDALDFSVKEMHDMCKILSLSNEEAKNIFLHR